MDAKLAARVRMVNRANEYANKLQPLLREALGGLLMTKVLKKDGEFLKSVEALLPAEASAYETNLRVIRRTTFSDLAWEITVNETVDGRTIYHTETIYLASMDGPVLRAFYHYPTRREDFHPDEIEKLRRQYEAAADEVSELKRKLVPFGICDYD